MKTKSKCKHKVGQILNAINGCEECAKQLPKIFGDETKSDWGIGLRERFEKLIKELGFTYRERRRFIGKGKSVPDGEGKKWLHSCHSCEVDISKFWFFIRQERQQARQEGIEELKQELLKLPKYEVTDDVYSLPSQELVEFFEQIVITQKDLEDLLKLISLKNYLSELKKKGSKCQPMTRC